MKDKTYLCIDMKSFFASVECVDRGLDPMTTNLVVADPNRGSGAICLAITPSMKALGIRNRCRIFEIPRNISYITAMPRMKRYMEISANIYSIYLKYISPDDIHVYSVDECFLDVTSYNMTPKEMVLMLTQAVFKETGVTATAGIGTNLFLAKVALDITAKHADDHIGILDEKSFKATLWHHKPIMDIWGIGHGIATRLEKYGAYDLYGITQIDEKVLYKEFGINAEYLIDHANGIEPCTIQEIHDYKTKSSSLSNGQVLFEDYKYDDALLVMKEMVDQLTLDLVEKHLVIDSVSISVGYANEADKSTGGSRKFGNYTNSYKKIVGHIEDLYRETTKSTAPIRRLNISFNNLRDDAMETFSLFDDVESDAKEKKLQETVISIKNRYGKNAVLKGMSYQEKATARKRNKLVGGHNSE
jgi:DNA polymerase V